MFLKKVAPNLLIFFIKINSVLGIPDFYLSISMSKNIEPITNIEIINDTLFYNKNLNMNKDNVLKFKVLTKAENYELKKCIDTLIINGYKNSYIGNKYSSKYSINIRIFYKNKEINIYIFNDTLEKDLFKIVNKANSFLIDLHKIKPKIKEIRSFKLGMKILSSNDTISASNHELFFIWRFIYMYKDKIETIKSLNHEICHIDSFYLLEYNLDVRRKVVTKIFRIGNKLYIVYKNKWLVLNNFYYY